MELGKCTMYTDYVFKKVPEFMASSDRFLITSGIYNIHPDNTHDARYQCLTLFYS